MTTNKALRRISAEEFARRLKIMTKETDKRLALFLGAGCSVSSGIPAAGNLVKDQWLPRLRDVCAPERKDLDTWAKEQFPNYDPNNPAASYGATMGRLFLSPEERQREIENLCDGKFPGFGYAVLASLVAMGDGHFNVVLTTNFDDLMADALYLFSPARPLVIHHESLAGYIRPTRTRPLVVKLHGDNRLSPKNTADETNRLKEDIDKQVRSVLCDRGLIFIGYGGNDVGIKKMLQDVPEEGLPLGVFWVSRAEPQGTIRPWLESRNAIWVEKGDFDELMLLVRDSFNLPHPDRARFDDVFGKYKATYDTLSAHVEKLPSSAPDASAMKEAVKRADKSFPDAWAVVVNASRLKKTKPDQANALYAKGLEQFPGFAPLLGSYAVFLTEVRKDYDGAEEHYRRALAADPNNANNLANYAVFLTEVREDYDGAEEHYRRALAADPNRVSALGNYAVFLTEVRKDYDGAEEHFRRAVAADPNHADNLGNCAGFLLGRGKDTEGLSLLEKVLSLPAVSENPALAVECWFYAFANRPAKGRDEALRNLKRVLEAGGRSPDWNLAPNIAQARKGGHPDAVWLEKLADVISGGADIKILDAWPRWKKA
jgi:Tfp pilus assembly protein PilF